MVNENSTFGGFLTDVGDAKQTNANALQTPWKISRMLLGDANGNDPTPQRDQTQLINQRYSAALNQLTVDPDNPAILIAEIVLPPDVGGWWIRELGLEDADGDFIAVANCAPSYKPLLSQGSGRNQVVRMHIIMSNTANVELKIDPSIVLATREYVDDQRTEHEASRNHPLATAAERGMAQFATEQQHRDGIRSDRAVHPDGLHNVLNRFGIGVTPETAETVNADLNTYVTTGIYGILATSANGPTANDGTLLVYATTLDRVNQIYINNPTTGDNRIFHRQRRTDGTWLPWVEQYHSENLHTAFTGNGQTLAPNGIQPLPGGLILQWGVASTDSTSGDNGTLRNFTATFPNQAFRIVATDVGSGTHTVSANPHSPSQFRVWALSNNGVWVNASFNWLAIGR